MRTPTPMAAWRRRQMTHRVWPPLDAAAAAAAAAAVAAVATTTAVATSGGIAAAGVDAAVATG